MKKFLKGFVYAWDGILDGFAEGRNMKSHGLSAVVVAIAGWLTGLSMMEWLIIVLLIGGMMSLELMNTAVEYVVDLVTSEYHPLAKKAKDIAAGSVLIFALTSAVIGCLIFFPKWFG
ncbi:MULTISPECIES: diacylglycerol kinase family protein [Sporosarcina]|uniref:diacylglycerol kinase family protein n=1 Tax=Sporosarcina TaxID=1569 RepID=UPI00129C0645|nr:MULTISPECIES: diacylglycerol kinase family protein [Sporosarcina]GKV64644.1 undecaprenol kinase [Sporosarcina sp. NCCP-2331]GLB54483.1 undecaprenol kinase [Sporosarcina sp. NCCP-2378]